MSYSNITQHSSEWCRPTVNKQGLTIIISGSANIPSEYLNILDQFVSLVIKCGYICSCRTWRQYFSGPNIDIYFDNEISRSFFKLDDFYSIFATVCEKYYPKHPELAEYFRKLSPVKNPTTTLINNQPEDELTTILNNVRSSYNKLTTENLSLKDELSTLRTNVTQLEGKLQTVQKELSQTKNSGLHKMSQYLQILKDSSSCLSELSHNGLCKLNDNQVKFGFYLGRWIALMKSFGWINHFNPNLNNYQLSNAVHTIKNCIATSIYISGKWDTNLKHPQENIKDLVSLSHINNFHLIDYCFAVGFFVESKQIENFELDNHITFPAIDGSYHVKGFMDVYNLLEDYMKLDDAGRVINVIHVFPNAKINWKDVAVSFRYN
jgi:hypothetical protein